MKATFKASRKSPENYFLWRAERSKIRVERVNRILDLNGKNVLDLGCGLGSLSKCLSESGAKVTAADINEKSLTLARKLLIKNKTIKIVQLKEDQPLPFNNGSFDVVFLFDVIEHVANPRKVTLEAKRVLKTKGILYVEFTPYYSIVGHHLYDYSKLPIHILPEKLIKKIVYGKRVKSFITHEDSLSVFKTLNKLKISEFQNYMGDMQKLEERFIMKYPEVFEINLPIINFFGSLKDYATMSFEGLYRKIK